MFTANVPTPRSASHICCSLHEKLLAFLWLCLVYFSSQVPNISLDFHIQRYMSNLSISISKLLHKKIIFGCEPYLQPGAEARRMFPNPEPLAQEKLTKIQIWDNSTQAVTEKVRCLITKLLWDRMTMKGRSHSSTHPLPLRKEINYTSNVNVQTGSCSLP